MTRILSVLLALYLMFRYGIHGAQELLNRENRRLKRKIDWLKKWN